MYSLEDLWTHSGISIMSEKTVQLGTVAFTGINCIAGEYYVFNCILDDLMKFF